MITFKTLQQLALSFPAATEEPHFDKVSFRVKGKIFATYDDANKRACLKLSIMDQDVFSLSDRSIIYPVDNKWGKQGWTNVEMSSVNKNLFRDALTAAYCHVAPKKLVDQVKQADHR